MHGVRNPHLPSARPPNHPPSAHPALIQLTMWFDGVRPHDHLSTHHHGYGLWSMSMIHFLDGTDSTTQRPYHQILKSLDRKVVLGLETAGGSSFVCILLLWIKIAVTRTGTSEGWY
jgi:hypothetical protein